MQDSLRAVFICGCLVVAAAACALHLAPGAGDQLGKLGKAVLDAVRTTALRPHAHAAHPLDPSQAAALADLEARLASARTERDASMERAARWEKEASGVLDKLRATEGRAAALDKAVAGLRAERDAAKHQAAP